MAFTQSSKFSGVTCAASRTIKESDSTHLMRDLVSCMPMSWPKVKLYWLIRGVCDLESRACGALLLSRSSLPTFQKTQTHNILSADYVNSHCLLRQEVSNSFYVDSQTKKKSKCFALNPFSFFFWPPSVLMVPFFIIHTIEFIQLNYKNTLLLNEKLNLTTPLNIKLSFPLCTNNLTTIYFPLHMNINFFF